MLGDKMVAVDIVIQQGGFKEVYRQVFHKPRLANQHYGVVFSKQLLHFVTCTYEALVGEHQFWVGGSV